MLPFTFSMQVGKLKKRKKFELGLIISARNSSAEAFVLQQNNRGKKMAAFCFFLQKLKNGDCNKHHTSSKTVKKFHANLTSQATVI